MHRGLGKNPVSQGRIRRYPQTGLDGIGARAKRIVLLLVLLQAAFTAATPEGSVASAASDNYSPYADTAYPKRPLWGDTHVHTDLSFDASILGVRLSPREAYQFASGKTVVSTFGERVALSRPLDWLAVTDHSDGLNLLQQLSEPPAAFLEDSKVSAWVNELAESGSLSMDSLMDLGFGLLSGKVPDAIAAPELLLDAWSVSVRAAEEANQPGIFTAIIGYEWTPTVDGNNLHRNVLYRDGAERALELAPFTVAQSAKPEDLWRWMDAYESTTGGQVLAIPHNGNLSNGWMFPYEVNPETGLPLDVEYLASRQRWEPLYEVTQIKGDGEAHPLLSPEDEFADFERWDSINLGTVEKTQNMLANEYAREALKQGLRMRRQLGVNPYQFGLAAGTDSHTGLSTADEDNFFGKNAQSEPSAERQTKAIAPGEPVIPGVAYSASGYTAVWALENTRESIFDAMKRKEVYATTGPRITLRFFGGWQFTEAAMHQPDPARTGYEQGVAMGASLPGDNVTEAPTFLVWALRDPEGQGLDRLQIVKGWTDAAGATYEKVYDIACSDKRPVINERCQSSEQRGYPDAVGAPALAGAGELRAWWKDPDFDSRNDAFYYVRALQKPTKRWHLYDAERFGTEIAPSVPSHIVERAYSSPIWYATRGTPTAKN